MFEVDIDRVGLHASAHLLSSIDSPGDLAESRATMRDRRDDLVVAIVLNAHSRDMLSTRRRVESRDAASFFRADPIVNDVDANHFLRAACTSRERRVARENRVESQKMRFFSILRVTIEKYFLTASGAHLRS